MIFKAPKNQKGIEEGTSLLSYNKWIVVYKVTLESVVNCCRQVLGWSVKSFFVQRPTGSILLTFAEMITIVITRDFTLQKEKCTVSYHFDYMQLCLMLISHLCFFPFPYLQPCFLPHLIFLSTCKSLYFSLFF